MRVPAPLGAVLRGLTANRKHAPITPTQFRGFPALKILAAVPLERELEPLAAALRELGLVESRVQIGRLPALAFGEDARLIAAEGGLGKTQFAIQTLHLAERTAGLDLVVCAGTAGGLDPALRVGDAVAATESVEHDFKWGMYDKPQPRFAGDARALSALRAALASERTPFAVRFGAIAGGDEDIVAAARAREIRERHGAIAVAWEGPGGARAARFAAVPFLEIRGVSDGADESAVDEFERNIPLAMRSVALLLDVLSRTPSFRAAGVPK